MTWRSRRLSGPGHRSNAHQACIRIGRRGRTSKSGTHRCRRRSELLAQTWLCRTPGLAGTCSQGGRLRTCCPLDDAVNQTLTRPVSTRSAFYMGATREDTPLRIEVERHAALLAKRHPSKRREPTDQSRPRGVCGRIRQPGGSDSLAFNFPGWSGTGPSEPPQ